MRQLTPILLTAACFAIALLVLWMFFGSSEDMSLVPTNQKSIATQAAASTVSHAPMSVAAFSSTQSTTPSEDVCEGFFFFDGKYIESPYKLELINGEILVNGIVVRKKYVPTPNIVPVPENDLGVPDWVTEKTTSIQLCCDDKGRAVGIPNQKWQYLIRHYSPKEASERMVQYLNDMPCMASIEVKSRSDKAHYLSVMAIFKSGEKMVMMFAPLDGLYAPPASQSTTGNTSTVADACEKDIQTSFRLFSEYLQKNSTVFLCKGGSICVWGEMTAATDLPIVLDILRSISDREEKRRFLRKLHPLLSVLADNFVPSKQLEQRVKLLVEKKDVIPKTFEEFKAAPNFGEPTTRPARRKIDPESRPYNPNEIPPINKIEFVRPPKFQKRKEDVSKYLKEKRSQEEEQIRTKLLSIAQSDEELAEYVSIMNGTMTAASTESLGVRLLSNEDKYYGTCLSRPLAILRYIIYIWGHEKPLAFSDDGKVYVRYSEARRVLDLRENIKSTMAKFYPLLFANDDGLWQRGARKELRYKLTEAMRDYGSSDPNELVSDVYDLVTEDVWAGAKSDPTFCRNFVVAIAHVPEERILKRLEQERLGAMDPQAIEGYDIALENIKANFKRLELCKDQIAKLKNYVLSPEEEKKYKARCTDLKANRGCRLTIGADVNMKEVLADMAAEYVKYADDVALPGYLALPSLLPGDVRGLRCDVLICDKSKVKTDNVQMTPQLARAVGIIVNSANGVESLPMSKVAEIFSGKAKTWQDIGVTSDLIKNVAASGMAATDWTAKLLAKSMGDARLTQYQAKKNAEEIITAVATDPGAIAFVDLTQLPADNKAIKILSIGDDGKAVAPSIASIGDGSYPLAEILSAVCLVADDAPKAAKPAATTSPTTGAATIPAAKAVETPRTQAQIKNDFYNFMATCGKSASSPYCDATKSVQEIYRKHGLISLAMPTIVPVSDKPDAATKPSSATQPVK